MSWLRNFFSSSNGREKSGSVIDVVIYVASLASNPAEIDPILEDLRELTASTQPGQPIPESMQAVLARVYKELETHLVNAERLRVFTRESIRQKINQKFPKHNQNEEFFWRAINNT